MNQNTISLISSKGFQSIHNVGAALSIAEPRSVPPIEDGKLLHTSKSLTIEQIDKMDSDNRSSAFGNKSAGPAPLLTTSPSLSYCKDPKDQIIKSL